MLQFLILICIFSVYMIIREIWAQRRHLTENDVRGLLANRLSKKEYHRVIGHLGICEKCQKKLDFHNKGKEIEEHLIDN